MKSSFAPGRVSTTLEITFKGSQTEFLTFYKQSLDHLTDPQQNPAPAADFPRVTGYVIKPGGYIFLQTINPNKESLRLFLQEILKIQPEYLKDIVLVGRKWLKLDVDWIPKSDKNFNYIVFENKILKVIPTKNKYLDTLNEDLIAPQSWVWLVEIV
jgi:hypothetical protein